MKLQGALQVARRDREHLMIAAAATGGRVGKHISGENMSAHFARSHTDGKPCAPDRDKRWGKVA